MKIILLHPLWNKVFTNSCLRWWADSLPISDSYAVQLYWVYCIVVLLQMRNIIRWIDIFWFSSFLFHVIRSLEELLKLQRKSKRRKLDLFQYFYILYGTRYLQFLHIYPIIIISLPLNFRFLCGAVLLSILL